MPIRRPLLVATLALALLAPGAASALCGGDCDGDGTVTISELMVAVNIALGRMTPPTCPGACPSPPICIDYLLAAVAGALDGDATVE